MLPLASSSSAGSSSSSSDPTAFDGPLTMNAATSTTPHGVSVLAEPEIFAVTMTAAGTGMYYTLPIQVGGSSYAVQLDTGSSDLWLASSTCMSQACKNVQLYNPLKTGSTAIDTNEAFQINYVIGTISGEIYYDTLKIGGRTIPRQALAAADSVENEDMAGGSFSGVLGLALPGNSIIANTLPGPYNLGPLSNLEILPPDVPTDGSLPSVTGRSLHDPSEHLLSDRATTPDPTASTSVIPFMSLSFGRPSDPRVASQLGLRSHLPAVCDSACSSNLTYVKVVESPAQEPLFWRSTVQAIDVMDHTTGQVMRLAVGGSAIPGQALPVGLLDSGAQAIYMANRDLINAIYGSQGVGPSADGNYYLDCKIAIQMAITIANVRIPVHPLDLSDYMSGDGSHKQCLGGIQWIDPSLVADKGDIILGAAFMRNAYTVLSGPAYTSRGTWTTPTIALVALTDSATSATEFQNVRVLNQAITPPSSTNPASSNASGVPVTSGRIGSDAASSGSSFGTAAIAGVSVAAVLLLAVGIFLSRYLILKRRFKRNGGNGGDSREKGMGPGGVANGLRLGAAHDPYGTSNRDYAHVPPSSPGSSMFPASIHGEEDKIRAAAYGARRSRGSVGSSTLRSFSESEDDEKAVSTHQARKSSATSGKFSGGASSRQGINSILGGGFDDVDFEKGIDGTEAPVAPDDDDEFQFEASPPPGRPESLASVDGYAAMPILGKGWRIQDERSASTPNPSSRPGPATRTPSESSLSAADSLLLARREARRSRSESPSINRASASTVSSSATLHLGSMPSPTQHSYPPGSTTSPQTTPSSLPTPPISHRPSLFSFSTNLAQSTIIESPFTSPITASPEANRPPLVPRTSSYNSAITASPPTSTRPLSITSLSNAPLPRGPNRRTSTDSTRSNEPVLGPRRNSGSVGAGRPPWTESSSSTPGVDEASGDVRWAQ